MILSVYLMLEVSNSISTFSFFDLKLYILAFILVSCNIFSIHKIAMICTGIAMGARPLIQSGTGLWICAKHEIFWGGGVGSVWDWKLLFFLVNTFSTQKCVDTPSPIPESWLMPLMLRTWLPNVLLLLYLFLLIFSLS